MQTFPRVARLKPRHVLALPLPAPTLSGIWAGLADPLPFDLTLPLVQSLQEDPVTAETDVDEHIPPPGSGLIGFEDAVHLALLREVEGAVDTNWDADSGGLEEATQLLPNDPHWAGRRVYSDDRHTEFTDLSATAMWPVVESIGGANGWYSWPLAWRIRGVWDTAVGGA